LRSIQQLFTSLRQSLVKFDDKWVKEQAESSISDTDFTNHVFTLQSKDLITIEAMKSILIKFGHFRSIITAKKNKLLQYDLEWAKKQAKTDISKDGFKDLLEDL